MPNMSYVRFENTLPDLFDCFENIAGEDLSETEEHARTQLILTCIKIVDMTRDEWSEWNCWQIPDWLKED
jgi:hypothetical protein